MLFASCTEDKASLEAMRYDRCVAVREVVAERLGPPHSDQLAERMGEDVELSDLCGSACLDAFEDCSEALRFEGLEPLRVPRHIRPHLKKFDRFFWATHERPLPSSDYMLNFDETCGISLVPDQLGVTYAGHGVNSYSLNLRFTVGPIAFVGQIAWGGAYGNSDAHEHWSEVLNGAEALLAAHARHWNADSYARRPWFVSYSDFRDNIDLWSVRWVGETPPPDGASESYVVETSEDLDELVLMLTRLR